MIDKIKKAGNIVKFLLNGVSIADKVAKTVSSALKHLKNFDEERQEIWGDEEITQQIKKVTNEPASESV